MGIHHSSDTKTSHDHDNNCQMCHSTASLSRASRVEAERRLRLARGGGPRLADTSLRVGRALGRARRASGRAAAPTCAALPRTTKLYEPPQYLRTIRIVPPTYRVAHNYVHHHIIYYNTVFQHLYWVPVWHVLQLHRYLILCFYRAWSTFTSII